MNHRSADLTPSQSDLGLTVVQKVVRAHRGRLDVAPNNLQGSVFSLWIPA